MDFIKPSKQKITFLIITIAAALILFRENLISRQDVTVTSMKAASKSDVIPGPINVSTWPNISKSTPEKPTLFLGWTTWYTNMLRLFDTCPELNCMITLDWRLFNESAAVIFFIYDLKWDNLPPFRKYDQYYILHCLESPDNANIYGADLESPEHRSFFNLTMTYRLDSNVPWPYGVFEKITVASPRLNNDSLFDRELINIVKGKSKLLAWLVSNCQTRGGRELFVEELQNYTTVDVYSKSGCGPLKCPRGDWPPYRGLAGASPCERMLTKDYKFYLALENTICRDYITEKFYFIMEKALVIPIVLKRKIIMDTVTDKETAFALNRSFIAVDDFENVQAALYEYIKYLDGNITTYMEYFEWRKSFQVYNYETMMKPGCDLCRLVKQKKKHKIKDLYKWWYDEAHCHRYKLRP